MSLINMKNRLKIGAIITASLIFNTAAIAATTVQTIALFDDKAMLSINGERGKIISVGQIYKAVKLIESTTDQAVIEVDGRREILTLNSTVVLSKSLGPKAPKGSNDSVRIWADRNGLFQSDGSINGRAMKFLVDTGANLVVLNSQLADRIDLEYRQGTQTIATTASGATPMYLIEIEQISVAGIELRNIQAGVIVGGFPVIPLLGMSFLERVEMNRSGAVMELKK